jgi:hypothetical protein
MSRKAAPMVYARVVRALAASGVDPQRLNYLQSERMAESLNREFQRLGIRLEPEEIRKKKSVSEIAEVITERILVG